MQPLDANEALERALEARSDALLSAWIEEDMEATDGSIRRAAGGLEIVFTDALMDLGRGVLSVLGGGDLRELEALFDGTSLAPYADRVVLTATHALISRAQRALLEAAWASDDTELLGAMPGFHARSADAVGALLDVSLRRTRASMPAEAAEFQEIAAVLKDTLYSTLAGGMVRYVSPSIEALTGHTMEDFLSDQHLWSRLVAAEDLSTYRSLCSGVISRREPMEAVYRLEHRGTGCIRHVLDRATPVLGPGGEVVRLDGILIDITDRIDLESRLERAEQLRVLGQLARDVAHDFNNLLVSILGHTDILLARLDDADGSVEGLRHIAGAAEKGARLTERLLAFARGSASPGSREPVRLDDIARDVIELARPSAPGNLELRLDVPPRIPMVDGNATSLGEAILNLLLNGIHACQEGSGTSVTLKIGHGDVDDGHLVGADATAVLEVIDDGIGMSEAVRARVFEPLFTTRTEHGGTGLGCAVAYGVAVEHGGVLEVESTLGEGTVFSFVLPALGGQDVEATPMAPVSGSRSSAPEGPAVVDHMEQAREREPTGPRILAVDDEANVGQLMADLLGGAGFRVTIANDGESALEVLAEDPDAYDLMILDVMMHSLEGGGLEVLARARELRPDLPVVFCTGHSNVEDVAIRELIATTPLLEKPFRAAALIEAVRDALAVD